MFNFRLGTKQKKLYYFQFLSAARPFPPPPLSDQPLKNTVFCGFLYYSCKLSNKIKINKDCLYFNISGYVAFPQTLTPFSALKGRRKKIDFQKESSTMQILNNGATCSAQTAARIIKFPSTTRIQQCYNGYNVKQQH